ncbi:hypothetical protein D3C75_921220 [compost metagenome]
MLRCFMNKQRFAVAALQMIFGPQENVIAQSFVRVCGGLRPKHFIHELIEHGLGCQLALHLSRHPIGDDLLKKTGDSSSLFSLRLQHKPQGQNAERLQFSLIAGRCGQCEQGQEHHGDTQRISAMRFHLHREAGLQVEQHPRFYREHLICPESPSPFLDPIKAVHMHVLADILPVREGDFIVNPVNIDGKATQRRLHGKLLLRLRHIAICRK